MEPIIGQIQAFGFNFAPRGWAKCDGQLLAISQYTALFSLLGTIYGGDGRTTFGLPDLRGRVMMNYGNGPGLSSYIIGQKSGFENVYISVQNLPAHSHQLFAQGDNGNTASPQGAYIANAGTFDNDFLATNGNTISMNSGSIGHTGGNSPISIIQPSLAVTICIALEGIFPSRS